MTQQTIENLKNKNMSTVTPDAMMLTAKKLAENVTCKQVPLTEQKMPSNLQHIIVFEEDLIKRAAAKKSNAQSAAFAAAVNNAVVNAR